jgi:hypothetical protein
MKSLLPIFILAVVAFVTDKCVAQTQRDTTKLYRIETKDGNEYVGKIVSEDSQSVRFKTENLGELTIRFDVITKITEVNPSQLKQGELWLDNPQATRYFWSPNGYGLKAGEAYYQNVWVLFNQVSVGISDNISIGAGLVPLFLFAGAPTPVWITPKFSIPVVKDKFNIGAGGLLATVIGEEDTSFGILYGITTFGNRDRNLSIGLGYGYAGDDLATAPTVTVSSMIRTSRRGYFLTENYFIGGSEENLVMLSFGGRRIIKRAGLDFGLFIPISEGDIIAIPWLGLTVPLNK